MDMELEQKQEELINHFVQQASSLSGSDLASLVVEATSHPSLFAFSKILSVPSILQLEGTDDSVYLDVLRLFAEGTLSDYKRNAGRLPELVHDQELKLKQLTMLTLAETNKELPYDQLMQQLEVANVPELEEFLIHKCMHVGIVRGEVDTLRNRFGVQFAAVRNPRPEQHGSMIQELSKWSDISESLPILIEEKIDWADKICKPNKQHRMEDEDEEIKRSLKDRAHWDHAQRHPWLISSLEMDGKVAEEPKKEKKRKNKMKAKQKNSSHDDLEAKYGLDEGEEEGLKSEEAEGLRSEEEEKKKGIIEDSGKTKKRTKEMNRQQRKRKKDRKARKRAAMVGANTSVKKNKDKKGQKKEPVSTVPHDTSSSSGESESAQDEVSTVLSTPSKHQTGEAAAIMHDVLANEDVGKPGVEDEVLGGSDTVTATSQVQTPNATHDEMDQLRVVQEQTANMEQNVEKKLNSDAHAFKQYEESFNSKLEAQFQTLSQQFEKSVNSKLEAHFQTLGQQAVQQINMQRKLENQMTKIEKAVEQKLNSNSHAFNQFEKLFNSKLEAQFQTLGQQAVQINLGRILPKFPSLLSQDVLISLFKLLAGDVNNDRLHKIVWMMTVANCINLADPRTGKYARSVLSLVNRSLFCIIDTSLTLTTIELRGIEQLTSIITSKLSESD